MATEQEMKAARLEQKQYIDSLLNEVKTAFAKGKESPWMQSVNVRANAAPFGIATPVKEATPEPVTPVAMAPLTEAEVQAAREMDKKMKGGIYIPEAVTPAEKAKAVADVTAMVVKQRTEDLINKGKKTAPAAASAVPTAAPAVPAVPAAPAPAATDIYNQLGNMSDAEFVKSFEKNRPAGVGYTRDEATGKIKRLIENPETKAPATMTNYELAQAGSMLTPFGHIAAGIAAREQVNEARRLDRELRSSTAQDRALQQANETLKDLSKTELGQDQEAGFFKMATGQIPLPQNLSDEARLAYTANMEKAFAPVKNIVSAWEAKKKGKATREEILQITKAYAQKKGWTTQ